MNSILKTMTNNTKQLTEEQIQKYRKRAQKYVSGSGRLNPKWLPLEYITPEFLDTSTTELTEEDRVQLYPFEDGSSDELKFRVLNIQLLCCSLADEESSSTNPSEDFVEYTTGVQEWIRELLVNNKTLRNKLKIQWEPLGSRITNKILKKNESTNTRKNT
jgi:hypothetical protein